MLTHDVNAFPVLRSLLTPLHPPTMALAPTVEGLSLAESDSNATRAFKTIFIPADETKPVEEWNVTYNNATEVSCLMDKLKPHFAAGEWRKDTTWSIDW
jgi:hypothetical protein